MSYFPAFPTFFQILIHIKTKCCFQVLRIPVDYPASLSSPGMPRRHWPVALGLHKINLLTHLNLQINWFSCGTPSLTEKELCLGGKKSVKIHTPRACLLHFTNQRLPRVGVKYLCKAQSECLAPNILCYLCASGALQNLPC